MIKQLLPLVALLPGLLHAQQQVIPFTLDGALDSVSADTDEYNTAGRISVNGVDIIVPKNLQFQFPAAWVGVREMAAGKFTGNEVTVYGNYVDGKAIAGIVQIAQFALEANSGKIKSLEYDGKITLEGGQVVRINDPNAVFSAGYKLHPEFTADDVNPSVTAFSGFPMCVPRSADDPKCPSSNRPAGSTSFDAPDPLTMAPFKIGDYLEFEGHKVGNEIIAYGITCPSVQILTPNGPTYIRVEEALIGVIDRQSTNVVEFADSRMIGYTSTPGGSVLLTRSEIDPCTGKVVDQDIGSASPRGARLKWEWRSESTTLIKYAREYKATSSNGVKETNGGQILAGQYIAPVAEWIFPEITAPGTQPAKLDFTQMTWLTNGLGPDANGKVWGPIFPWPDASSPAAPKACEATTPTTSSTPASSDATTPTSAASSTSATPDPNVPIANAGKDLTVKPSAVATLNGTADNAGSFTDLTYSWTQVAGPTVTLSNRNIAKPTFTVPAATSAVSYSFELTVASKSKGTQSKDTVVVDNSYDTVTITAYTWTNTQSGTISVTAQTTNSTNKLTLQLMNPTAGAILNMVPVSGSPGKFTYNARSTKQPSQGVKVTSSGGGSSSRTTISQKLKRWHARFFGTA